MTGSGQNYPNVSTYYGPNYELEYEVVFEYEVNEENEKLRNPNLDVDLTKKVGYETLKKTDKEGEGDKGDEKKPKNYLGRVYYNKLLMDRTNGLSIVETISEQFNVSLRTIFNMDNLVAYDVINNGCYSYHRRPEHNINYYDVQDLMIRLGKFFNSDGEDENPENKFEYIGDYMVHNIPTQAFERQFKNYNKKVDKDHDSENQDILDRIKKNMNCIFSNNAIVTHYYPKGIKNYWGEDTDTFKVPLKIEIRLFGEELREEIAKLTINVASFKENPIDYELFDLEKCVEHSYDYNWFLLKFEDPDVKKYKNFMPLIKNSFRLALPLSNLR